MVSAGLLLLLVSLLSFIFQASSMHAAVYRRLLALHTRPASTQRSSAAMPSATVDSSHPRATHSSSAAALRAASLVKVSSVASP